MPFMPPMGDRPPIIRELITLGGDLPAGVDMSLVTQFGQSIIHNMSGQISHFLLSQRQNHRLSGHEVTRTQRSIPPLELMYESLHGREALTINCTVTPEMLLETVLTEDINLDGYFAYFYNFRQIRSTPSIGLCMNGEMFFTARPASSQGTIICAFGPTALRCHSLNDKSNPNEKLLYPPILPPPPQLPGYFALNWADERCPVGNVMRNNEYSSVEIVRCSAKPSTDSSIIVVPQFNPVGPNFFEAYVMGGNVGITNISNGGIFAEFFDRTNARLVSQSWKLRDDAGRSTILVNDTPMFNGTNGYSDAGEEAGLFIDLSLKPDPPLTGDASMFALLNKIPIVASREFVRPGHNGMYATIQNRSLKVSPGGGEDPSVGGIDTDYTTWLERII